MKKRSIYIIITLFLLAGFGTAGFFLWKHFNPLPIFPMTPITLTTSDNVSIVGNMITPPEPKGAVLLLHMMPATKESWEQPQQALGREHVANLAIDLRGHGQSTQGPAGMTLDYNAFTDEDHQASRHDVQAGIDYLTSQGFAKNRIAIIGASIGANLALQQLSQDPEINSVVLLSPGLDFRGVETEQYARSLADNQALYTLASRDDQYSFDSSRTLYNASTVKKDIGEYEDIGHGTTMIENKPALVNEIVRWVAERIK